MTQPGTIAITGASGAVGSRVAHGLAGRAPLVLITRDAQRAPVIEGADVRLAAGYDDGVAMATAFRGCQTALLVSGRESAVRRSEHSSAVRAAVEAGVERIVYLSFQGASEDCTFTFGRDHWHTEQLIRSTPMGFTFLRDSFYLAALVAMCGTDGVIRGPAGNGAVAAVDHDDVAAVAVTALLGACAGETWDVTGPEPITLAAVARLLGEASGRRVSYVDETEAEAYASRGTYGAPLFEVQGWVSSYQAIAAGDVAGVSDTVERVTGRRAINFATFLQQHPESYAQLSGAQPRSGQG